MRNNLVLTHERHTFPRFVRKSWAFTHEMSRPFGGNENCSPKFSVKAVNVPLPPFGMFDLNILRTAFSVMWLGSHCPRFSAENPARGVRTFSAETMSRLSQGHLYMKGVRKMDCLSYINEELICV